MSRNARILIRGVLIVCLLAAIAITGLSFRAINPRRNTSAKNTCINNLRQIDGAKQQWALENHKTEYDTPTWDDVRAYLKNNAIPKCPDGGVFYIIGRVGVDPTCSIRKHRLPSVTWCSDVLYRIDAAKQQWALKHDKTTNDTPTWDDVRANAPSYLSLKCPGDGVITIGRIGVLPSCSLSGHNERWEQSKRMNNTGDAKRVP